MENIKEKKRKIALLLVGLSILMGMTIGVTFAFYNYNREGDANVVKAGNIEFNSDYTNVSLTNVFPIDSEDVLTSSKVETITITVTGGTTFSRGIEYLISLTDVSNHVNGKYVPVNILVTASGLGDSDNSYFTNRGSTSKIYKILAQDELLGEERLVVGYIPKSTTNTEGTITIKAYLDESKIVISDTYDGSESNSMATTSDFVDGRIVLTTEEWKTLKSTPISFRVLVEAYEDVWVDELGTLKEEITKRFNANASYIKSYATVIENNPTFTTQDTTGTNNSKQTVYYYNGSDALDNGNVLFAGFCWQIVRTTDTGGVKLLYNGVADNNKCLDNRSDKTWKGLNAAYENKDIRSPYLYATGFTYDLSTGKFNLTGKESSVRTWSRNTSESFIGKVTCLNQTGDNCDYVYYIDYYDNNTYCLTVKIGIDNIANYKSVGVSSFAAGIKSISSVGYMFNNIYIRDDAAVAEGTVFGGDFIYQDGMYTLTNIANPSVLDSAHHYTCGSSETTCSTIRYYFENSRCIVLENGEHIEDALYKMLNYKGSDTNLPDENINVYSSAIKTYIDNWYDNNLSTYENFIDTSTVYCNNRLIDSLGAYDSANGELAASLIYANSPESSDLGCTNLTDRFSKENPSAYLRNPVALLTISEARLMGSAYVVSGEWIWTMSPVSSGGINNFIRGVIASGYPSGNRAVREASSVRPAITIKSTVSVLNGDGSQNKPYQIGPLVTRSN